MIYLDHNATTPIDDRVVDAMQPYLHRLYGNPSSLYRLGRISRSAIDTAREQVAALIDAPATNIIFTSGGTEANVLALSSAHGRQVHVSAIEHPALLDNVKLKPAMFSGYSILAVNPDGKVDVKSLQLPTFQPGDLVSVMLANNETGAIQDVPGLTEKIKALGGIIHSDAVQAAGKIPFSFRQSNIDLLSLSSHKIYGPKGCGALVCRPESSLNPIQLGGYQEQGLRAGTENVAAIVGFGKAAELAKQESEQRVQHLLTLRKRLEAQLKSIPEVVIFAEHTTRLPNTVQFGLAGINGEMLLMQLDQHNIAVSSGSACKAGSGETSPVLAAMGVSAELSRSAIRVSLGKDNTEQEIDQFVSIFKNLVQADFCPQK